MIGFSSKVRLKFLLVMFLGLAALIAIACGSADEEPSPTAAPQATAQQPAQPPGAPTAAPSPAARPPTTPRSDVTITMAIPEVTAPFGDFEVQTYGAAPGEGIIGIFDQPLVHDGTNPLAPWGAEQWSINPAGDELTLKVRQGMKVNTPEVFAGRDFGFITAEDVAWSMNQQNAVVNEDLGSAVGAQLGATFAECNAVDGLTVKCPIITSIVWGIPISEFDINDTSVRLDSKKAYDEMGAAAIKFVPVGSGPMVFVEVRENERLTVEAMEGEHWATLQGVWDETPKIGRMVWVQVPDTQTRMSMMQTGQADLAEVDFSRLRELEPAGLRFFPTMSDADTMTLSVIWPGNLFTDLNAKTNEALTPWLSQAYEEDFPWIGNPWGDRVPYTDTDNPPGMSDMEQARLVRWALSHAIDREGQVDVLLAGLGTPLYQEVMGPKFPGWQPERTVTAAMVKATHEKYGDSQILGTGTSWAEYKEYDNAAEPNYEWPWEIPTDIAEAERLLDLAGYPRRANGTRFEINMNKYRCETGPVCLEQADAVAADWEKIGVRTTLLTEEYGSVVVPRMRDRVQAWPVVKNCSVETANYPFDWPPAPADSTFSRPAWGCAFETKFLDYMYININGERDKAKREALHQDMVDYYYYWQLYSGVAQPPRGVAGNPDTVESWDSRSTAAGFWGRPQHIVPAR